MDELFDFNDVEKKTNTYPTWVEVEECNLGTEKDPKIIKLSKSHPVVEKQKYISLFKEFNDVFSWSYADLKQHDSSII